MQLSPHMQLHFEATLQTKIPAGLAVYTDGSRMEDLTSLVYCVGEDGSFIYEYQALTHPFNAVYQTELRAISLSIDWLIRNQVRRPTILSDSQSNILSLVNRFARNILVQRVIQNCYENTLRLLIS